MGDSTWVHNLDPFLIQFSGNIGIRWYGLAYLIGFVAGAYLMIFMAKRGRRTLRAEMVTDYITYVVLGTMIGGRVGYALFYAPELLTDFSSSFPFWGVLRVWEGGMASHGGIMGIIVAAILFARRHKLNWMHLNELTVLGGSIGILLGRIANFINGELFGRATSPDNPLAVKFPAELYLFLKHDKEKAITDVSPDLLPGVTDAVSKLGTVPLDQWQSWISQVRTSAQARFQIQTTIHQLIDAVQNGNESVRVALGTVLTPRHPSQLYEGLLEGLFTFLVAFFFWKKPRKPGVVGLLWLTTYLVVRIICEQFRMPDAEIGFQLFGLTRGQWLSIAMVVFSFAGLVYVWRRDVPVISGWGPEAQALRDREP